MPTSAIAPMTPPTTAPVCDAPLVLPPLPLPLVPPLDAPVPTALSERTLAGSSATSAVGCVPIWPLPTVM